ncbi:MAG TPA: polysaccharide biosynthesis C-terminal domain-containing protein, partial [Spirochaetota bacterium]
SSFGICFFIPPLIVILLHGTYFDLAWVRLFVVILFTLLLYKVSVAALKPKQDTATMGDFARYAIPFGMSAIITNVYQRINIIILSLIHGSTSAGIFTNGFMLFSALFFIPANIMRVLLPHLYKTDRNKNIYAFQFAHDIYTKYLSAIGFFIMTMIILYAKDIIHLIFGAKYDQSIIVLQISSLAIPFTFSASSTIITSLDKQSAMSRIQTAGLVINVVSNVTLIYFFNLRGAAASAVITYGFLTVASLWYLKRSKIITLGKTIRIYLSLCAVTVVCATIKVYALSSLNFIISGVIVATAYIAMCVPLLVTNDDIRIVKEMLGIKKKH